MDGQRFDSLTRSLAVGSSRRQVLKGMAGGALAGALAWLGVGSAGARQCRDAGDSCRSHAECCLQFCDPATFQCACPTPCPGANADACCTGEGQICCTATAGQNAGASQCVTPICSGGLVFNAATCSCGCPAGTETCQPFGFPSRICCPDCCLRGTVGQPPLGEFCCPPTTECRVVGNFRGCFPPA